MQQGPGLPALIAVAAEVASVSHFIPLLSVKKNGRGRMVKNSGSVCFHHPKLCMRQTGRHIHTKLSVRLRYTRVALMLVSSQVVGAMGLDGTMHNGIIVPKRINSVFAELHTGGANLFQILRVPETSFTQNFT